LTLFIFFKSQKTLPKLRLYKKNSKDKWIKENVLKPLKV
jgi:hypothetical protein